MKINSTWIANLLMGVFAAFSPGGFAADSAPLTPEALSRMPPRHRHEYIQQQIEKQNGMAAQATTLDTKPPVLTAFAAGATVDLTQSNAQLVLDITVKDNLSGFQYGFVEAQGPSGQIVWGDIYPGYPATLISQNVILTFNLFAEPGNWRITALRGRDAANNWMFVNGDALAKLGNTQFTVVNANGGDITPPKLISGRILSPTVSLSTPPKGTASGSPYIGAVLSIQDQGTNGSPVSGPRYAYVKYCLPADLEENNCLYIGYGSWIGTVYGQEAVNFRAYGAALFGTQTGKYFINSVELGDHAGNYVYLKSKRFGGTTDFTKLFSSTTITVNP